MNMTLKEDSTFIRAFSKEIPIFVSNFPYSSVKYRVMTFHLQPLTLYSPLQ